MFFCCFEKDERKWKTRHLYLLYCESKVSFVSDLLIYLWLNVELNLGISCSPIPYMGCLGIASPATKYNPPSQTTRNDVVCTMIHVNICMHDRANVSHQQ